MFDSPEDKEKFLQILFPFLIERQANVKDRNIRFVHYTTAQTAASILKNKEFWMRETSCMSDFLEVKHGLDCLFKAYKKDDGSGRLKQSLEGVLGIASDVEALFDTWQDDFKTETYLTCFSEHMDAEDENGRLSMWRAYGGTTGVALVVKNAPFFLDSDVRIYASPVEYLDNGEFEERLNIVAENIIKEADFIGKFDRNIWIQAVFTTLRFAALCTKHPGFREEKEWRIICSPTLDDVSQHLIKEIEVINGIPQLVYKLKLEDKPNIGLIGIELPTLIDRIIIGPTEYPLAMWKAFVELLTAAGVENPLDKVVVSNIPLRG